MHIPATINMNGHDIEVRRIDRSMADDLGFYDSWRNTITLNDDDVPESVEAEVLLHEIFEAIKCRHNLEINHRDLTVLSETLFGVIRRSGLDFRAPEDAGNGSKPCKLVEPVIKIKQGKPAGRGVKNFSRNHK